MFKVIFEILGAAIIIPIVCYILIVVAQWKIFTKGGEEGWKSLIPFYNAYIQLKITWNVKFFWILLALSAAMSVFSSFENTACQILAGISSLGLIVLYVMINNKLAKAFGHGVGYTILLILFPNIMTLILGFGQDKYLGPQ